MKIYTKTGDKGQTSLVDGKRVPKYHIRLEAYGTVDELNSHLGLLRSMKIEKQSAESIKYIQNQLFSVGSILATENPKKIKITSIGTSDISMLEKEIDRLTIELPPLRSFVLPGGDVAVSNCHIARTVCRRAERICHQLSAETEIDNNILIYLNRLSDYLFTLSRKIAADNKVDEIKWELRK